MRYFLIALLVAGCVTLGDETPCGICPSDVIAPKPAGCTADVDC